MEGLIFVAFVVVVIISVFVLLLKVEDADEEVDDFIMSVKGDEDEERHKSKD
jgi:hypothetical protein